MNFKQKMSKKVKLADLFGWQCYWCECDLSIEGSTLDHLIPKSRGGSNSLENLRLTCRSCNQSRGNSLYPLKNFSLEVKNAAKDSRVKHRHSLLKVNKDPKFVHLPTT